LDVGNQKDNETEQDANLDDIIEEELQTASPSGSHIYPQSRQTLPHQLIEPLHSQNVFLKKCPHKFPPFSSYIKKF